MTLCRLFVYFILFSVMGWIYESIFCTIKNHHWANRGFLFGPLCPIYGVGAVACVMVCDVWFGPLNNLQIFVICFIGSIVLEYLTHYVLEKLFHAVWWDYSKSFCNINGRVCLPASIGFGIAGILVLDFFYPFAQFLTSWMNPMVIELVALLFMAVFGADLALTVGALSSLMQNVQAIEKAVNEQMEEFYQGLEEGYQDKKNDWAEKRAEITAATTARFSGLLNLSQRHVVHTVKEFRYPESLKTVGAQIMKLERGIKKGAKTVREAATKEKRQAQ